MAVGRTLPGTDGVVGYTRAGFGPGRLGAGAARAVGWCFLAGVVLGAPVVCLIGAAYVADLIGGGPTATVLLATVLLAAPDARVEHGTPVAPDGWWSVGRAASVLMLSFVGWEAISPLVARL